MFIYTVGDIAGLISMIVLGAGMAYLWWKF